MTKRLHNYLLENYPLLWNMRLHSVLGIMLIMHSVHYFFGYASFTSISQIGYGGPEAMFFNGQFAFFSIIGSFVIFIVWLMRVFRNNAFKSFYPFSNGKLYLQFFILFLVCLLNITYYFSFTAGYIQHAKSKTNFAQTQKDAAILNRVSPYLQESKDVYAIENRCMPAPFPVMKQYKTEVQTKAQSNNESATGINYNQYYFLGSDSVQYSQQQLDSMSGGVKYSYLNICHYRNFEIANDIYDYDQIEKVRRDFIRQNLTVLKSNPHQLKEDMLAFIDICERYEIKYKLDPQEWFRWVNNPPNYPVEYTIRNYYFYPGSNTDLVEELGSRNELNPKGYFVELNKLEYTFENIYKVHQYHLELAVLEGLLIAALALAILFFTYRVTSKRIWLITFIGSTLLSIIVAAFTAVIASLNRGANSAANIMIFYLLLIFAFLVVHFLVRKKTISGVALNWFTWSAGFILPLIMAIYTFMYERSRTELQRLRDYKPPIINWVEHNILSFIFICFLVYIVGLIFIMPLYRRWQAMPED